MQEKKNACNILISSLKWGHIFEMLTWAFSVIWNQIRLNNDLPIAKDWNLKTSFRHRWWREGERPWIQRRIFTSADTMILLGKHADSLYELFWISSRYCVYMFFVFFNDPQIPCTRQQDFCRYLTQVLTSNSFPTSTMWTLPSSILTQDFY